jgi:molybdopterin synthase catalytic subunit
VHVKIGLFVAFVPAREITVRSKALGPICKEETADGEERWVEGSRP